MKKYFGLLTIIALIMFYSVEAGAQGRHGQQGNKGHHGGSQGTNFVDADGDGVCDLFIDEDGDGVCDHCTGDSLGLGNGHHGEGQGTNFVDADGDGICDLFIDEDGDGVCDHCTGDGLGQGNQGSNGKGQGNKGHGLRLRDGSCDVELEQNYPNPFLGSTKVNVNVSEEKYGLVNIYDTMGNKVFEVFNGKLSEGENTIDIQQGNLRPGIYYYQVVIDGQSETKRMILGNQ